MKRQITDFVVVDREISIVLADNGYMVTIKGEDKEQQWINTKIVCETIADVSSLLHRISSIKYE